MPDPVDKAKERTSLARGEVWLLRVAAATGVASLIAHGTDALDKVLGWF